MNESTIMRFGKFTFCTQSLELRAEGEPVLLQPQPSELLAYLLSNANRIVTREEIQEHLWPGRHGVFDQNLNFCINKLRTALQDSPQTPQFLETIPKRGYRFKLLPFQKLPLRKKLNKYYSIKRSFFWLIALLFLSGILFVLSTNNGKPQNKISNALMDFKRAEYLRKQYTKESIERSLPIYKLALVEDPNFAAAHASIAFSLYFLGKKAALIESHIEKALALDSTNEMALLIRLALTFCNYWDINEAHKMAEHLLTINPQHVRALHYLSLTTSIMGDMERAIDAINRSLTVDPGVTQVNSHAGWMFYLAGDLTQALKHCEASVQLEPNWTAGHQCTIQAASAIGLDNTVITHIKELLRINKASHKTIQQFKHISAKKALNDYYRWDLQHQLNKAEPNHFFIALAYARIQDYQNALKQLKLAKNQKHMMLPTAFIFPEFSSLRNNVEFKEIMRAVKLK
ncbi:winged helix-turn-helix domain-containing protein [Aliikangiella sp. IMCC44359]|uniref:winged helix-turn-helix domain-containing protein n=1 Tax=Aliikangiella sp. IMCC44359 TaxID=3459125 RepID=UPI00403AF557